MYYVYILLNEAKTRTYTGVASDVTSVWKNIIPAESSHHVHIVLIK